MYLIISSVFATHTGLGHVSGLSHRSICAKRIGMCEAISIAFATQRGQGHNHAGSL